MTANAQIVGMCVTIEVIWNNTLRTAHAGTMKRSRNGFTSAGIAQGRMTKGVSLRTIESHTRYFFIT